MAFFVVVISESIKSSLNRFIKCFEKLLNRHEKKTVCKYLKQKKIAISKGIIRIQLFNPHGIRIKFNLQKWNE